MTAQEILKASGLTDEQITAAVGDPKVAAAFDKVLAEAETARQAAATDAQKAAREREETHTFWKTTAEPEMNKVYSDNATLAAERDFYRTQAEEGKKSGFIPKEAPTFAPPVENNPPRNPNGQFVANQNEVPGSPKYVSERDFATALAVTSRLMSEHQRLFNEPLPNLEELMTEAGNRSTLGRRVSAEQVWNEKYKVAERRQTIAAEAKQKELDAVRKEEREKVEREYTEKYGAGANPNTTMGRHSDFSKVAARSSSKDGKETWMLPEQERRERTRDMARELAASGQRRVN